MVMNSWSAFLSSCSGHIPLSAQGRVLGPKEKVKGGVGREISPRKGVTQILWPRDFCLPTFCQIPCKLPAHEAALNVQVICKQPRQGGGTDLSLWIWAQAAASQHTGLCSSQSLAEVQDSLLPTALLSRSGFSQDGFSVWDVFSKRKC